MNVHRTVQGQALTEFILITLLLIPLFLVIPLIAKYQDLAHTTQVASRYVSFEAMTRNNQTPGDQKPDEQLANEVHRRFFGDANAPIQTMASTVNIASNQHPFWRNQQGAALIKNSDNDINIGFSPSSDSVPFNPLAGMPSFNVREELGLQAPGIYTANISVTLVNLPAEIMAYTKNGDEFKNINLSIARHTSVLVDAWSARNPEQVESRIDRASLFPGKLLASMKPAVGAIAGIVESPQYFPGNCLDCGPKLGELAFWRDAVPKDRLK